VAPSESTRDPLTRALGNELRALRAGRGYTQRQLGGLLDWDRPEVARLEVGAVTPHLAALGLLTGRLGVRLTAAAGGVP
jgi:transcriptional regulator with XRE-family HTH domain